MTRINICHPSFLTDQHLMAEYREINMVAPSMLRSLTTRRPILGTPEYTLNAGHVKFFYDKGLFLQQRFDDLVKELKLRDYAIDDNRLFNNSPWDSHPHFNLPWMPTKAELKTNLARIHQRVHLKVHWYRYYGNALADDSVWLLDVDQLFCDDVLETMLYRPSYSQYP